MVREHLDSALVGSAMLAFGFPALFVAGSYELLPEERTALFVLGIFLAGTGAAVLAIVAVRSLMRGR